jgi:methyl-accepting chemotaxis protein
MQLSKTEIRTIETFNKILGFALLLHLPLIPVLAMVFKSTWLVESVIGLVISLAPLLARTVFRMPPARVATGTSLALMFWSMLLIHMSKGMVEFHFHIFVSLAVLSLYAQPLTVISAAALIAVHHVAFYFALPGSLLNYDAGFGIILVHAAFVVLETLAIAYIQVKFRSFLRIQDDLLSSSNGIVSQLVDTSASLRTQSDAATRSTAKASNSVQATNSALAEFRGMMKLTQQAIEQGAAAAASAKSACETGARSSNELAELMSDLKTRSEQLSELHGIIAEIESKTNVINKIVDKTETLAFNASVEAARAGDAGRGFAVVAEEVSKLASLSGGAAKEIGEMLDVTRAQISDSTEATVSSLRKAHEVASRVLENFGTVDEQVGRLSGELRQIGSASHEQMTGIELTSRAVVELDQETHANIEIAQKLRSLAQVLKEQSLHLESDNAAILQRLSQDSFRLAFSGRSRAAATPVAGAQRDPAGGGDTGTSDAHAEETKHAA